MKYLFLLTFLTVLFFSNSYAGIKGEMDFTKVYQNTNGAVTFLHQKHADRFADDCGYCHSALETFGGEVNKLYAHKVCKLCHESHHGPTECKQCHAGKKGIKK